MRFEEQPRLQKASKLQNPKSKQPEMKSVVEESYGRLVARGSSLRVRVEKRNNLQKNNVWHRNIIF